MRTCKKCNGTSIRSRKNYPHGKKSKAMVTLICNRCGSVNVEEKSDNKFRRRR